MSNYISSLFKHEMDSNFKVGKCIIEFLKNVFIDMNINLNALL